MTALLDHLRALVGKGELSADDALEARRQIYGDGAVSLDEAAALVAANDAAGSISPEWRDLYVEALVDILVHQQEPDGYVTEQQADWLMSALAADGKLKSGSELEALIRIMEVATQVPPRLCAFVREAVKAQILARGRVDRADVMRLRRVLFAAGGSSAIDVTREEAELLFDINDAMRGRPNDVAWQQLFAQTIGAAVLAASGYRPPSRGQAVADEAFLHDTSFGGAAGLLGKMAAGLPHAFEHTPTDQDLREQLNRSQAAQRTAAETVTGEEAAWLAARIGRDGQYDETEKALIRFLKSEASDIHPSLQPLLSQAA